MKKEIERIKKVRLFLLDQVKDLSVEQLNEIPAGFRNNIIWHLGHLTASQQGLCYARAGSKPFVEEKYLVLYRPGTVPVQQVEGEEVDMIKDLLIASLDQFDTDMANNVFANYTAFTTRYGVEIAGIDDAVDYVFYHEGLHSGQVMAMKKLVQN